MVLSLEIARSKIKPQLVSSINGRRKSLNVPAMRKLSPQGSCLSIQAVLFNLSAKMAAGRGNNQMSLIETLQLQRQ